MAWRVLALLPDGTAVEGRCEPTAAELAARTKPARYRVRPVEGEPVLFDRLGEVTTYLLSKHPGKRQRGTGMVIPEQRSGVR